MTQLSKFSKYISLVVLGLLSTLFTLAQDEAPGLEVDIDSNVGAFYTQIWFWVIIGLVFLLLLIALLRGDGKKNKE
ncbi:MAG TPA: hypothetical protein VLZ33_04370 [Dysgonamonadaceae bacterium]|nr:hypothetical protein [Dysgonamonadaceae bacterium]